MAVIDLWTPLGPIVFEPVRNALLVGRAFSSTAGALTAEGASHSHWTYKLTQAQALSAGRRQ